MIIRRITTLFQVKALNLSYLIGQRGRVLQIPELGNYKVDSLSLGLQLVELFKNNDRLTVTYAAQELGITRSRAHRLLSTLVQSGYASRGEPSGYLPGGRLLELSSDVMISAKQRFELRAIIQELWQVTSEAVHTSVLVGGQLLVLDGRRSKHPVDIGLRSGMLAPAHAMAGGKLLLSYYSSSQIEQLYPEENLARRGPRTITSRSELIRELASIRRMNYAMSFQESENAVNSVATLLSGENWRNRVAVVISVPIERGSLAELNELRKVLLATVAKHKL